MQIAVRSQIIAGVALLGIGAVAVTPMTRPVPENPLQTIAFHNTAAMVEYSLVDPFRAFGPVVGAALGDTYQIIRGVIADPFPIAGDVLANQADYLFATPYRGEPTPFALVPAERRVGILPALGEAAFILGAASFDLPAAVNEVRRQAMNNDLPGAIQTIQKATLLPLTRAADAVVGSAQWILARQLQVAQDLVIAVPEAAGLIFRATINAANEVLNAGILAGQNIMKAAATMRPTVVWNAAVKGATDVALAAEQVTIGNGTPEDQPEYALAAAQMAAPATPASVKLGALRAQQRVREAIRPELLAKAVAAVEVSSPTGGARSAVADAASATTSSKSSGVAGSARPAKRAAAQ